MRLEPLIHNWRSTGTPHRARGMSSFRERLAMLLAAHVTANRIALRPGVYFWLLGVLWAEK